MAKKATKRTSRKKANPWEADRSGQLDSMFGNMVDAATHKLGLDGLCLGDKVTPPAGLPLPSLALRYLFQSTVFPLGRVVQIAGPEGSCKSAFLFDLYRWHCAYGGGAVHCENENKDSAMLRNAIMEYNLAWLRRMEVAPTTSLEQWQDVWTFHLNFFRMKMDEKGGPGRTLPVIIGVDALTSSSSEKEQEKSEAAGHVDMRFSRTPRSIADFMRDRIKLLKGFPFTLAGTNHLKPGIDARTGLPTKNIPGGKAVPFMATFLIEMSRTGFSGDIDTEDYGGIRLRIRCEKNSLGPSRKQINADMVWWYVDDPETGVPRQQIRWDWEAAAIECLAERERSGRKGDWRKIMDVVDLHTLKRDRKVWSAQLGIPEDSPLNYREAGAILESRKDLLTGLYPLLGIMPGYEFQPGMDYRAMIDEAEQQVLRAAANQYSSAPEEMPAVDLESRPGEAE